MPDWRDDYLVNLREAERNNPVNKDLIAACSQLADRVAALEAEKVVLQASAPAPGASDKAGKSAAPAAAETTSADPTVAQLRLDLAEALRAKGQLQEKFKAADGALQKLRDRARVDEKRLRDLTAERNSMSVRLKDRSEELVGKNKMLKDVQDENLTLNIQLDVMEQGLAKVRQENKDLVDRWMKRMGQEADAMNLANEPKSRKGR